jgi:hypothetical protein
MLDRFSGNTAGPLKGNTMPNNFRLVSSGPGWFTVDSRWTVHESDLPHRLPYLLKTLQAYRDAEPDMNWRLQTRGEVRDWHDYE